MKKKVIRVLVVDDSKVAEELLVHELRTDPALEVVGTAADGVAAVEFVVRHRPDVVVMDLQMPRMDGVEATRRIMELEPVPVVAVSASYDAKEVAANFRTMEAGAVALMAKPRGPGHPEHAELTRRMIETVKLMSEVKIVRRLARRAGLEGVSPGVGVTGGRVGMGDGGEGSGVRLIAMGVSTGGPPVLQTILGRLPKTLAVPVVIVQHIAPGFLPGMAEWLEKTTGFPVRVPGVGELLLPGVAYLGPDGWHLGVTREGRTTRGDGPPENGMKPAVSYLFRSVAAAYGRSVAAVLLTGMGRDGAEELRMLRELGALTVAQDRQSSLIHGMPGEAVRLNAALHVLPPEGIAELLGGVTARRG